MLQTPKRKVATGSYQPFALHVQAFVAVVTRGRSRPRLTHFGSLMLWMGLVALARNFFDTVMTFYYTFSLTSSPQNNAQPHNMHPCKGSPQIAQPKEEPLPHQVMYLLLEIATSLRHPLDTAIVVDSNH